jgi:hypothetical protein
VWIGRDFSLDTRFFEGSMKDLRIYNRTLTPDEVSDLYNGLNVSSSGLLSHLPMNEGYGSCCYDASGNGHNAIYKNALNEAISEITVNSLNGVSHFTNVTSIQIEGNSAASIKADNATFTASSSFYSELLLVSAIINFQSNVSLIVIDANGVFTFDNVSTITVTGNNTVSVLVRSPEVKADFGKFKEAYLLGGVDGQELDVVGRVSFGILTSDHFLLLSNFSIEGNYNSSTKAHYDELDNIDLPVLLGGLLAAVFASVLFSYKVLKRRNLRIVVYRKKNAKIPNNSKSNKA